MGIVPIGMVGVLLLLGGHVAAADVDRELHRRAGPFLSSVAMRWSGFSTWSPSTSWMSRA